MREPRSFFKDQIGLSDAQITLITGGKAVAKVLASRIPSEIFVFGAVFVHATPEEYVKLAFDMDRLRRLPGYLGAGRFSDPPALSDLEGFTLEPEDIRHLKTCRPGKCKVQLPATAMHELQESLDWSEPGAAAQVGSRVRTMALDLLQRYQESGNRVLGNYHDSDHPFDVNAQLQSLLGRSEVLPVYLPLLNRYMLDYPNATLADVESLFYWERVSFGLKPTLRLNHAVAYRSQGPMGSAHVVAVKQLYASHYFQLALDLTACVREGGRTDGAGFYLISLKGSTQQGLTGFRGSILRRIVVSRTRSAQESALIHIKEVLEGQR
ncbi:MAG: hypothetical protein SFV51_15100 [Bryobacteraceae bacterium]|nr:hypothetical protein [Bryobacteraceae bacterium]